MKRCLNKITPILKILIRIKGWKPLELDKVKRYFFLKNHTDPEQDFQVNRKENVGIYSHQRRDPAKTEKILIRISSKSGTDLWNIFSDPEPREQEKIEILTISHHQICSKNHDRHRLNPEGFFKGSLKDL